jgi:hypothetical protein
VAYSNKTGLPSVSDIIGYLEDTRWFKEWHAERGNVVHGWICADLLGMFQPAIHPDLQGYIDSYLEFKPHIKKIMVVEKRFSSERGYCGQVDLVALLDDAYQNVVAILDWKTSKAAYKTWQARIGGYYGLTIENGIPVTAGATIRLRKAPTTTGKNFPLVDIYYEQEIRENYIDFLCAQRVYNNLLNDGKIYASFEEIDREY